MIYNPLKGILLSFSLVLCISTAVSSAIINGVILDSELQTPVKNVTVVLENVTVTSNEAGEFALDTDKVSTLVSGSKNASSIAVLYRGVNKEVSIQFPSIDHEYRYEVRDVKGRSLLKGSSYQSSKVVVPLHTFADGMLVLTISGNGTKEHFWICTTDRGTYTLNATQNRNSEKSKTRVGSSTYHSEREAVTLVFQKLGYDTLVQAFDILSDTLKITMDRFVFCGNDVAEEDEVCDGDERPCNIANPLEYAMGETPCKANCSGYDESDCVPHPDVDVSGNSNGKYHKEALSITSKAHYNILRQLQVGMIEGNFHDIIDSVYDAGGANGLAFNHITGSGPNSIILHYEGKNRVLQDGDVLLVDIGAKYNGYCADITRTYPVNGTFTDRQREIYQLVLDAKNAAAVEMSPGVHSLNQMTTFVKNFFKASPLRAKDQYGNERTMDYFFKHGLCHYIGKQVHGQDLPFNNSEPVKVGRLFTIEPGLYIESEGFGVRLEDTYIMTSRGAETITPYLPIEADHIEALMEARELNRTPGSYKKEYEEVKTRSTHMNF